MTLFPLFGHENTFWTKWKALWEEGIYYFSRVDLLKFLQTEWDLMLGDGGFVTSYVYDSFFPFLKPQQGAMTHFEVGRWYCSVKLALPHEFRNYQSSQKFLILRLR